MSDFSILTLSRSRLFVGLLAPIVLALGLGGCATNKKSSIGSHSSAISQRGGYSQEQIQKAVKYWGEKYQSDPDDREVSLNYAAALRLNDRNDQAVAVLRKTMIKHRDDREVAAAYGKALASKGRFEEALRVIRSTNSDAQPDWRLLSAEGAILDQIGQNADARKHYNAALKIVPNEPTILNNLGLSYALTGDLDRAEVTLRQAAAQPGADSRVRQNLALILGLAGKFREAEQVARNELEPAQAEANIAYLRGMLSQRNSWKEIKDADKKKSRS